MAQIAEKVRFRGSYGGKRREKLERYQVTASQLPGTTLQATRDTTFPIRQPRLPDMASTPS